MDQAIQAFDWQRMILGDAPPLFLLEIAFRTTVIYCYALLLLRWLGSRTIGQLSTIEFLLVIALGSAVGDAMFYPEVPLVHALVVITIVVVANKGLDMLIARSDQAQHAIDGVPEEAIRKGVICRRFLEGNSLTSAELFQQLRERGVAQLGEIESAFMETDGGLTVFKAKTPKPGLPITPPWEIEAPAEVNPAETTDPAACRRCGTIADRAANFCSHCGHKSWIRARL